MSNFEDSKLISRILLLGDKKSFDLLVIRHQSSLRRFLLHLTGGDKPLADDLAQETFIKAYLNLYNFKGIAKFSTWLYRIACNLFYDYQRKRKNYIEEDINMTDLNIETEENNNKEFSDQLQIALSGLKAEEKATVLLYYMEDMPVDKISEILALPVNTVKSHLYRSRQKIKTFLTIQGYEE